MNFIFWVIVHGIADGAFKEISFIDDLFKATTDGKGIVDSTIDRISQKSFILLHGHNNKRIS